MFKKINNFLVFECAAQSPDIITTAKSVKAVLAGCRPYSLSKSFLSLSPWIYHQ